MPDINKDRAFELMLGNQKQSYLQTHELMKLALRTAYILNAGTAAALLTYLGSKNISPGAATAPWGFRWSLLMFALGVCSAALTTLFAFFSQGAWTSVSEFHVRKLLSEDEAVVSDGNIASAETKAKCWRSAALAAWFCALALFISGCFMGYSAFAGSSKPAATRPASSCTAQATCAHTHRNTLCPRGGNSTLKGECAGKGL